MRRVCSVTNLAKATDEPLLRIAPVRRRSPEVFRMIQDGLLLCDVCKAAISLDGKSALQLLIEIVPDSPDRHYCEDCSRGAFDAPPAEEVRPKQCQ